MAKIEIDKAINYFLTISVPKNCEEITNLKLQKLLYYAQGIHLAMYDEPLFEEEIVKWDLGPVIPAVYRKYKGNKNNPIERPSDFDIAVIDEKTQDFLDLIILSYGRYRAFELSDMTHEEAPYKSTAANGIITEEMLKEYFKAVIKDDSNEDIRLGEISKRRFESQHREIVKFE